jgi:hypothetical protein
MGADVNFTLDEYGRLVIQDGQLAGLQAVPVGGPVIPPLPDLHPRSSKWPAFLHGLLKRYPNCTGCGRKAVTGHHIIPFHVDPGLELEEMNVALVCLPCHFVLCHAGEWKLTVPPVTTWARLRDNLKVVEAARKGMNDGEEEG